MRLRVGVAFLLVGLVSSACGSATSSQTPAFSQAPTTTARANNSQAPADSQSPADSQAPATTDEPPASGEPGPVSIPDLNQLPDLPQPELTTADEVVEAMTEPGMEDQAIMSMLDLLGIGVYGDNGTVILAGSDQSDADFYLFEPQARGLINLLESQSEEPWINFTDFQGGLAALGYSKSADELAQAYNDAYAAAPDEPITKFVQATAFISPEAQISPLGVWLMLLDGFVSPNPSTQALALAGDGLFASGHRSSWGVAAPNLQAGLTQNQVADIVGGLARVMAIQSMSQTLQITIEASPTTVHEGHGGPGSPATITSILKPCGGGSQTRSGGCSVPAGTNLSGFNVTWTLDQTLTAHGSASVSSGATTATDGAGSATIIYTPQPETPDVHTNGYLTNSVGKVSASVPINDVIQKLYSLPAQAALFFSGGRKVSYTATLVVEWHEPNALRVELTNPYDVAITEALVGGNTHQWGTDSIRGDLILDDDGVTYRGIMIGKASGQFTGKAYGKACSASWDTTQLLQVEATVSQVTGMIRFTFVPVDAPSGRPARGRCRPTQWKSDLSGVYFAPYNDYAVVQPGGLEFNMFAKPGGSADYPVPPGPTNVTIKNTYWHMYMEYLEPRS